MTGLGRGEISCGPTGMGVSWAAESSLRPQDAQKEAEEGFSEPQPVHVMDDIKNTGQASWAKGPCLAVRTTF